MHDTTAGPPGGLQVSFTVATGRANDQNGRIYAGVLAINLNTFLENNSEKGFLAVLRNEVKKVRKPTPVRAPLHQAFRLQAGLNFDVTGVQTLRSAAVDQAPVKKASSSSSSSVGLEGELPDPRMVSVGLSPPPSTPSHWTKRTDQANGPWEPCEWSHCAVLLHGSRLLPRLRPVALLQLSPR